MLIDWLIDWLIDLLIHWMIDWFLRALSWFKYNCLIDWFLRAWSWYRYNLKNVNTALSFTGIGVADWLIDFCRQVWSTPMNMQLSFPDVDMTSLTPHTCGTEVKVHEACLIDIILIIAFFSCLFNQFLFCLFSLIDKLIHLLSYTYIQTFCYFINLMMSSIHLSAIRMSWQDGPMLKLSRGLSRRGILRGISSTMSLGMRAMSSMRRSSWMRLCVESKSGQVQYKYIYYCLPGKRE